MSNKPDSEGIFGPYVYTEYHAGGQTPCRCILRDPKTDEDIGQLELLDGAFQAAGVRDGDEVVITVRKTGRRPFGDRKVRLVKPHTYERESPSDANAEGPPLCFDRSMVKVKWRRQRRNPDLHIGMFSTYHAVLNVARDSKWRIRYVRVKVRLQGRLLQPITDTATICDARNIAEEAIVEDLRRRGLVA